MAYLIVFIVAAVAGVAVYVVTLRTGFGADGGLTETPVGPAASAPGPGYLPIGTVRSDWQTRLTGLLGLIVAVVVAAVVLATTLYVSFAALFRWLGHAATNGGVSG